MSGVGDNYKSTVDKSYINVIHDFDERCKVTPISIYKTTSYVSLRDMELKAWVISSGWFMIIGANHCRGEVGRNVKEIKETEWNIVDGVVVEMLGTSPRPVVLVDWLSSSVATRESRRWATKVTYTIR